MWDDARCGTEDSESDMVDLRGSLRCEERLLAARRDSRDIALTRAALLLSSVSALRVRVLQAFEPA